MNHVLAVVSCGHYNDLWEPFARLYGKYWRDPEGMEITPFLVTDPPQTDFPSAKHSPLSPFWVRDNRWAKRLLVFCKTIKPDTLLLMHDDYFLKAPVRADKLKKAYEQIDGKTGCVRLFPCPGPDYFLNEDWGLVDKNAAYRVSCQAALWRTDYLCQILEQVDTSPEFELKGTPFAHGLPDQVLSWRRESMPWPIEYYCTAVVQGRWQRGALELCTHEGINVISNRPIDEGAL